MVPIFITGVQAELNSSTIMKDPKLWNIMFNVGTPILPSMPICCLLRGYEVHTFGATCQRNNFAGTIVVQQPLPSHFLLPCRIVSILTGLSLGLTGYETHFSVQVGMTEGVEHDPFNEPQVRTF